MKKMCIICGKTRGKRACLLNPNALICPVCCAATRHESCQGCSYYAVSQQYQNTKAQQNVPKDSIADLYEKVTEEIEQAFVYLEKKMFPKSYSLFKKLIEKYPRNPEVCFGMGTYHAMQKNYDEALFYFDRTIELSPHYAEAHFNIGSVYRDKADIKRMLQSYMKVVEIGDPNEDYVQNAKETIETFKKNFRNVNATLEDFFKGQDAFEQGMEAMEKSKWKKGIPLFQKSIKYYPSVPQPYNNLGICYAKLGQKELALAFFDKALEIDPNYEPAIVTRMTVELLKSGEKLLGGNLEIIDYYKDYSHDKKPYIKSLIDKDTEIIM